MTAAERISKAFRWRIARLLDRLPDTCWARLAMWATYPECHEFSEVWHMRHTAGDCERHGLYPYCGKCAVAHPQCLCSLEYEK